MVLTSVTTAVTILGLLGLTGCGSDSTKDSEPTAGASSSSASPSASSTPSDSATSTPTSTPTASPTDRTTKKTSNPLLLPAADLPGFNAGWAWSEKSTGPQRTALGPCGRLTVEALGAEAATRRSFVPTGDDGEGIATQVVGSFPDRKSVDQALAVLTAWHGRCEAKLQAKHGFVRVDPIKPVAVARGTASSYLTIYSPADSDEGWFDSFGVLSRGTTLELIRMRLHGQDFTYPAGRSPVELSLKKAATRLP